MVTPTKTLAKYRCRGCQNEFSFDPTYGKKMHCPRCRGTDCRALSPAVRVFVASKVATERESKKTKYERRSAKLFSQLTQHRQVFLAFMKMLEISQTTKDEVAQVLDKAVAEIEEIRKQKLERYGG